MRGGLGGLGTWDHGLVTRADLLFTRARAAGAMIATAESCTGGLIAGAITDIAGSSDVFDRGFVTYSNDAKKQMLDVQARTLITYGAVSEEVAAEMARGALSASNATLAVSVTGIAGPGGSEHKPEGRVCFGLVTSNALVQTATMEFGALGSSEVRRASVDYALELMIESLS